MIPIETQIRNFLVTDINKAIKLLYQHYYYALFAVANQILNDEEKSKDVVQETFIVVWLNANNYDFKKSKLYTWLRTIAKNKAIDNLRYQKTYNYQRLNDNIYLKPSDSVFNTDVIGLADNVAKLTPKYGTVIEDAFLKEYTRLEIAKRKNIPVSTVKSRVKIGLRELREIYIDKPFFVPNQKKP